VVQEGIADAVPFCFVRNNDGALMALTIDLNADVGESFGAFSIGADEALMRSITSANVAAGFHGGDPSVLRATIRLARAHNVAVGAHPGFPDLAGFGRREMRLTERDVEDLVLYQVAAVAGVAKAEGVPLGHVKPHGALYNMAVRDETLARAIVRGVIAFDRSLVLFGPPASALLEAGIEAGLAVAAEGFADRAYEPDGTLSPRARADSLITDTQLVLARTIRIVKDGTVEATDHSILPLTIQTICVHSDTPGAGQIAAMLRAGLESAGIQVSPISSPA
jgi:UPF0271 protein